MMWANSKRPRSPEVQRSPVVVKALHKRPRRSTMHSTLFEDQDFVSFSQLQRQAQVNTVHKSVTPEVKSEMRKQVGRPRKRSKCLCPWANEFFLMIYPWLFLFSKKLHAWKISKILAIKIFFKAFTRQKLNSQGLSRGLLRAFSPQASETQRVSASDFQHCLTLSFDIQWLQSVDWTEITLWSLQHYTRAPWPDHTSSKTRVGFFTQP